MQQEIIVLGVSKPYEISDGSKTVSGCSMYYTMHNTFDQCYDADSEEIGLMPIKQAMPYDFHAQVKEVGLPAVAVADFGMKLSGGKNVLVINGLDFTQSKKK